MEAIKLVMEAEVKGLGDIQKQMQGQAKSFVMDMIGQLPAFEKAMKKSLSSAMGAVSVVGDVVAGSIEKNASRIGKVFEKAINIGVSGIKDPKGALQNTMKDLIGSVGDVVNKMGDKISKMGKKMSASGAGPMQKSFGLLLRTLGPAVALVGTVAGGIAKLVTLLFDAESQAKDLNKSILDSGVAGGDLARSLGDAHKALDGMRDSATDFFNNMDWGTLAKDQLEIIGAFNEAGFTIREMTKDVTNAKQAMKDYQNATAVALTYSKLLGMSAKEVATQQAGYMESMGADLDYVANAFSSVFKTAQLSGFGVKRFYSMVQQATSGMTFYNVRLEEAAGLLIRLGKILGSDVAGNFLQQLNKGFVDESMQDRFKRVMTTGSGKMKEIFENSADDIAHAFGQKFDDKATPAIQGAFKEAGISVDFGQITADESHRKQFVDQLAKMDPAEQADLLASIRMEDENMARELSKLMKVSEGTKGGLDAMSKAMGGLDMGGTLAAKLNQANAVLGKPLHELNAIQLAAFENITGISGEQREILSEVSKGLHGNYGRLEKIKASGEIQALAAKEGPEAAAQLAAEQAKQLETLGAYVSANGQIMTASLDAQGNIVPGTEKAIDNMGEYIQSQGDAIADATKESVAEDMLLAREIAANTLDLNTIMEMGVQAILENIYDLLMGFMSIFGKGTWRKQQRSAMDDQTKIYREASKNQAELLKDIAKKEAEKSRAEEAGDIDKVAKLAEEIEASKKAAQGEKVKMELAKTRRDDISAATSEKEFQDAAGLSADRMKELVDKIYGEGTFEKQREVVGKNIKDMIAQGQGGEIDADQEALAKKLTDIVLAKASLGMSKGEGFTASIEELDAKSMASLADQLRNVKGEKDFEKLVGDWSAGGISAKAVAGGEHVLRGLAQDIGLGGFISADSTASEAKEANRMRGVIGESVGAFERSGQMFEAGGGDYAAMEALRQAKYNESVVGGGLTDYKVALTSDKAKAIAAETAAQGSATVAQGRGLLSAEGESLVPGMSAQDIQSSLLGAAQSTYQDFGGATRGDVALFGARSGMNVEASALAAEKERTLALGAAPGDAQAHLQKAAGFEQMAEVGALELEKSLASPEKAAEIQETIDSMLSEQGFQTFYAAEQTKFENFQKKQQDGLLTEEEKQRKKQAEEIIKGLYENEKKLQTEGLLGAMGANSELWGLQTGSLTHEEALAKAKKKWETLSEDEKKELRDRYGVVTGSFNDFVRLPDGKLISVNSQDTIVGMKPGGPIDNVLGGRGGGRGVVINIHGSQAEIYNTVKRVLKEVGM